MTGAEALDEGRKSLRKQEWRAAFSQLSGADREAPLEPDDLEGVSRAAYLTGREAESADFLARAHRGFLGKGDTLRAARCASWLAFVSLINGDVAQAGGWLARADRLLNGQKECVEKGYLLLPVGLRSAYEGDAVKAHRAFVEAAVIGQRFGDRDLVTMALHGQGRALIRQGAITRGVTLLDEAMVAVTADEVSPMVAGGVYCGVIEACSEIFDLGRAREWTMALEQWCTSQPEVVTYRGHCLVRRAEILQLHGAWADALTQARQACRSLSEPAPKPAIGAAFYRVAELHRLRSEFAEAEEAYRQASQWDRNPQPGFALLRLAQHRLEAAKGAIRRVAEEVRETGSRARVLDAYVEIMLAARDVPAARAAADELTKIGAANVAPFLSGLSARATGAVLLAEHDAREALAALRQSWTTWSELEAPYDAARARVLIALACRELGDQEAADLELAAAREVFKQLGAAVDLAHAEALLHKKADMDVGPLTAREVQVLRLVASGMTNRGIANKLGISEKTIARHLSNIFNKLDLSSRVAATSYAYQHNLL